MQSVNNMIEIVVNCEKYSKQHGIVFMALIVMNKIVQKYYNDTNIISINNNNNVYNN